MDPGGAHLKQNAGDRAGRRSRVRAALWMLGGVLLVLVAVAAALPALVPGAAVEERVVAKARATLGNEVAIGAATFDFWPTPRVVIANLNVRNVGQVEGASLVAEQVVVGVPVWSIISGTPRPDRILLRDATLRVPASLATASDGSATTASLPARALGATVGRIAVEDSAIFWGDRQAVVDELVIERTGNAVEAKGEGRWNGEAVAVTGSFRNAPAWTRGESSDLAFTMTAAPVSVGFDGQADGVRLDGEATVETASLRDALLWVRLPETQGAPATSMRLQGQVKGTVRRMAWENAAVRVGEAEATGSLQMERSSDRLSASGTLAFDEVALAPRSVVDLLTGRRNGEAADRFRLGDLGPFDLDLRFSASQVMIGKLRMTDVAAGLISEKGTVRLDIGDASVLDGAMSAALVSNGAPGGAATALRMELTNVDLNSAVLPIPAGTPSLRGRGSLSLALSNGNQRSNGSVGAIDGTGHLRMETGAFGALDLPAIVAAARERRVPVQGTVWNGETPFQALDIPFEMNGGVIAIREGTVKGNNFETTLAGRIDLLRQSVALRADARLRAKPDDEAAFFVGGTLRAPLVVPIDAAITPPAD